jgi:hypothetical protein
VPVQARATQRPVRVCSCTTVASPAAPLSAVQPPKSNSRSALASVAVCECRASSSAPAARAPRGSEAAALGSGIEPRAPSSSHSRSSQRPSRDEKAKTLASPSSGGPAASVQPPTKNTTPPAPTVAVMPRRAVGALVISSIGFTVRLAAR